MAAPSPVIASLNWMASRIALLLREMTLGNGRGRLSSSRHRQTSFNEARAMTLGNRQLLQGAPSSVDCFNQARAIKLGNTTRGHSRSRRTPRFNEARAMTLGNGPER